MRNFLVLFASFLFLGAVIHFQFTIPRVWTQKEIERSVLPFPDGFRSEFLPESIYYRLPERQIFKTYPVYVPGKEPKDYFEWLKNQEPELVFEESMMKSEQDWIQAGRLIFNSATVLSDFDSSEFFRLKRENDSLGVKATENGEIPFYALVIREKGVLEIGIRSCAFCHSKVMEDGSLLAGAQGNMPVDRLIADNVKGLMADPGFRDGFLKDLVTPWKEYQTKTNLENATDEELIKSFSNTYGGIVHRTGTSIGEPVSIPDLYYLEDRKYFDHSGRISHESIRDLMFYASHADAMEIFDKNKVESIASWPDSENFKMIDDQYRYSDSQLYALAKYLYSLSPPPNPHKFPEEIIEKGKLLFIEEGCITCHTPPFYTNNQLTPVDGFEIPESHYDKYSLFPISVETDPSHTLNSRRGTGYYKIPSLIAVWNRKALMHGGNITSLEELLDSTRMEEDFVPSGYMPGWNQSFPVPGHPFGLGLNQEDKDALISFLKTL